MLAGDAPWATQGFLDPELAARVQEKVGEMLRGGRTPEKALEVATAAMIWADHLVGSFESENSLPTPIPCREGCCFCCFNQVEVTPPEALLMGRYIEQHFAPEDREGLMARIERTIHLQAAKSQREIAAMRQELPCPLLREGRCSVYRVRPLVCRAMHALDAGECERSFQSQDLRSVAFYAHRYQIILSIAQGLLDGCRDWGCQAGFLDLAGALKDFSREPGPAARWIAGQQVFHRETR